MKLNQKFQLVSTPLGTIAINEYANSGEDLVLLHGNSACSKSFDLLALELAEHFHLYIVDLPGHGLSSKCDHYNLLTMSEAISIALLKLKVHCPHLLAHSLGGHVATHLSALMDSKSLTLLGYAPLNPFKKVSDIYNFDLKEAMLYCFESASYNDLKNLYQISHFVKSDESLKQFTTDYKNTDPKFRGLFTQSVGEGKFLNEYEILKKLPYKVDILMGEFDQQLMWNYLSEINSDKIRVQKVANSSHYVQSDNPRQVKETLLEKIKIQAHSVNASL